MFGKKVLPLNGKFIADDIQFIADEIELIINKTALNEIIKMGLRQGAELGFKRFEIGRAAGQGTNKAKNFDGMHDGCTTLSRRIHYYITNRG